MKRRNFLTSSLAISALRVQAQDTQATTEKSAESVLRGAPVISGPDPASLAILQAVRGPASGYAEISLNDGAWQKVLPEQNGLVALEEHVLKFYLPNIAPSTELRYRVTASTATYKNAYQIIRGKAETSDTYQLTTLDPKKKTTRFIIWNDTHENLETIRSLHEMTLEAKPDFLVWNGDQTNDVYAAQKMAEQYLSPGSLPIASHYPLAYLRGNHDLRGPAARLVEGFTHAPGEDFTYAFRSGPVACLAMDTGEDKPDDHPVFTGMVGCAAMRSRQSKWLEKIIAEPWFQSAPYKIMFCHIPLWWEDEVTDHGYYWFQKPCREAWLDLLVKAGIQLVISGHTHQTSLLPKTAERPMPQLIGGGPKKESATITQIVADEKKLMVTMKKLNGELVHELSLDPT